jgi:N-acetylmuramoyl-L-alanine amidase
MRRTLLFPLLLPALLASACAPPPEPRIDDLYRGLSENVPRLDPSLLDGRRIVIDPGHGGYFTGTRGQQGLEEASVNLGVSLYLWGLLREAGAEAYLTRSAQKDFLAGPDSTATEDLAARSAMIDSIQPDILVSIHHNAEPERDPSRNAVETYYKIGDPASRDLASAVHRHLVRNLGIDRGEIRPGNYYILREAEVPAILGEGSYLTHPKVEENLRISEKQRLEAEAYFLGILDYFSRGTPAVRPLEPAPGDSVIRGVPAVSFAVSDIGGAGIDPGGIEMTVNGEAVDASLDAPAGRVVYRLPWNSPNGVYEVALVVRNVLGNSSRFHQRKFVVSLPASRAVFESFPAALPPEGGTVRVRVRLLDRRGLSVADGGRVAIAASCRRAAESGKTSRAEWTPIPRPEALDWEAVVSDGVAEFPVEAPPGCSAVRVSVLPAANPGVASPAEGEFDEDGFSFVVLSGPAGAASRAIIVLDRLSGEAVTGARFSADSVGIDAVSCAGSFVVTGAPAAEELEVRAPGYQPALAVPGGPDTLFLDRWYGGALAGKRFVVNAEGAPHRSLDRGPLGLAGSSVNLRVARYLEEYLEAAGARVRQARTTEETPTDRDVVLLTNRFRASLYVEIRYRAEAPEDAPAVRCFFFPGSARGLVAATAIGAALARAISAPAQAPADTVTFPLQQTACPAVIVQPPGIGRIDEELRLAESWYQRRQAYGIFGGVLADAGVAGTASLRVGLASEAPTSEKANWLVTVDEVWNLVTSPEGSAVFDWLPPGRHRVVLTRGGAVLGPFDVDLESGGTRTLEVGAAAPR